MSVTQLCPDDLLLLARQGNLNLQDEARLSTHLARCSRCRVALEVGRAFDGSLGARVGDDAIAARVAAQATARHKRRWLPYVMAGGCLLCGSVAVAAVGPRVWRSVRQAFEMAPNVVSSSAQTQTERDTAIPPRPSVAPVAASGEPVTEPGAPSVSVETTGSLGVRRAPKQGAWSTQTAGATHVAESNAGESAANLFASANALRARGETSRARERYLELQARYPGSSEARVSLVSLGRVELPSDPSRALSRFDAYLAQSTHTTLLEEALFGRAGALARLGRHDQERATWRRLLEKFPASVYAERARMRLNPEPSEEFAAPVGSASLSPTATPSGVRSK